MAAIAPTRLATDRAKPPAAVYFDVGETLIRPRRPYTDIAGEVSSRLGIQLSTTALEGLPAWMDARVAERARLKLPFTFPASESHRFWLETYREYLDGFLPGAHALLLAEELLDHLSSPAGYALFDDTVGTLNALRKEGYRLGIISNWESWLPALLEDVGITSYFDHFVISGVCGIEKPDPGIFRLALEEGGFLPENMVYVGDRPAHDVEPAKSVGIEPILLDRTNRWRHMESCRRIRSLSDLPLLLRSLRTRQQSDNRYAEPEAEGTHQPIVNRDLNRS